MKKGMRITVIILAATAAVAAIGAGIYFSNASGSLSGCVTDASGVPVANVGVTDGRNVVKTDENGKFELAGWRKAHFVTLTVPAGYETEGFYIPIEKSKESYDFTLEKSELTARENHCFVQISDTEIGEDGTGEWLDTLKETVEKNSAAFLIHTGDICYEAGLKRHIVDMNTETMGVTVRYVIGNHDYVKGDYGEELYESLYGPVWYSFDVGKTHYVVTPFQTGADYKSGYNKNDRWRWLENDLENVADDMKIVMFNHTMSPSDDYVLSFDRHELDLKKHRLAAWVFGHYHYNYVYETDGVLNISTARPDCGGIDSSAAGARVINMDENGVASTEMVYYELGKNTQPQNTIWKTKLGSNVLFCDTVYDNGFVYTATVDDDYPRDCGVFCLNGDSGEIVWKYKTKNSIKNNVVISGNMLVAADVDGNVYCLDKSNGSLLWEKRLELGNALGTSSGICISDGVVYAGAARVVTALNLSDGSEKWSVNRDKGENSPAEFIVADGRVIVNSHWDALAALDAETGKKQWANDDEDIRFRSSTPLLIDGKTLLVADDDAIMLVDIESGKITSKKTLEDYDFSSSGQPAFKDGTAYIPTSENGIVAYDINKEKIIWEYKTGSNILCTAPYVGKDSSTVEASPIIDGENLIFGANDGYVYVLDASTGKPVDAKNAGSAVLGEAAAENGKIYASTFDGFAVCYEK